MTNPKSKLASEPNQFSDEFLPRDDLSRLFSALSEMGYQTIGPTLEQEAIVYAPIESVEDLPQGWTDIQEPGLYRIGARQDDAFFGYNVGPRSWKQFLFPPELTVSTAKKSDDGKWEFNTHSESPPPLALLGVRACELEAIRIQDRVFLEGPYVDPDYQRRRNAIFVIAVNCTQAAPTCFCTSMGSGPECHQGFDLAMTELPDGFVIRSATKQGKQLLDVLATNKATPEKRQQAAAARNNAAVQITKKFDTQGIRELLMNNLEHSRWDDIASRCLSCANCTMVCPTCFCSSVEEVSELAGDQVERTRRWDSCFNIDFSYINGGVVRDSTRNRYRQWLTHKLATWVDQFDTSGCVGCGRCITWCPVGIDLTEEVVAIRESSP